MALQMRASACAGLRATCRQQPISRPTLFLSGPSAVSASVAPRLTQQRSRQATVSCQAAAKAASSVKLIVQGRKLEVTDAIRSYIEDKITKAIENYSHTIKELDVTISARGGDTGTHGKKEQKVEVTIYTLRNGVVRVEDTESTLYSAIDLVCDKIERKLTKVKERAISKGRWPGKAGPKEAVEEESFEEYKREIITETRAWDREEQVSKQFAELNKSYPAEVLRKKVVDLDPMTADEAIDAMEAVGHDFFVFREMESDSVQVVYKRESGGYGVLIPRKRE